MAKWNVAGKMQEIATLCKLISLPALTTPVTVGTAEKKHPPLCPVFDALLRKLRNGKSRLNQDDSAHDPDRLGSDSGGLTGSPGTKPLHNFAIDFA